MKSKNVFSIIGPILSVISTIIAIVSTLAPNTPASTKITIFLLTIPLIIIVIVVERVPFFITGHKGARSVLIGISCVFALAVLVLFGKALWDGWHYDDQTLTVTRYDYREAKSLQIKASDETLALNCPSIRPEIDFCVKNSSTIDVNLYDVGFEVKKYDAFTVDDITEREWGDDDLETLSIKEDSMDEGTSANESIFKILGGDLNHSGGNVLSLETGKPIENLTVENKGNINVRYTPTVLEPGKYTLQMVFSYIDDEENPKEYRGKEFTFCYLDNSLEEIVGGKKEHSQTDGQPGTEEDAQYYFELGTAQYMSGDYDSALANHEKALAIRKEVLGEEDKSTASTYSWIGYIYYKLGDYVHALMYHQKALDICQKVLGEDKNTASAYSWVGYTYYKLGDYDKALTNHQEALDICRKVLGEEDAKTANAYAWTGYVYYDLEDYDNALVNLQKALDIRLKVLGEEDEDTAYMYYWIGCMYSAKEDYKNALTNHQKALATRQTVLGKEHKKTAESYYRIGCAYYELGEYDNALTNHQKSLDIRLKVLGEDTEDTAISYSWIGYTYCKLEEYEKALDCFEKALDIRKRILGEDHKDTKESEKWLKYARDSIKV